MHFPSVIIVCLASVVLLQPGSAALARPAKQDRDAGTLRQPRAVDPAGDLHATTFTPDSAAREIQRMHGGRVLAVQADGAGYRVKMLKDGEVRIYQVDP